MRIAVWILLAGCGSDPIPTTRPDDASIADASVDDVDLALQDGAMPDACSMRVACPSPAAPVNNSACSGWGSCSYDEDAACPLEMYCNGTLWLGGQPSYCPPAKCVEKGWCGWTEEGARCVGDAGECVCEKSQMHCADAGSPRCPPTRPLSGRDTCDDPGLGCVYIEGCVLERCDCGRWWHETIPYPCGK